VATVTLLIAVLTDAYANQYKSAVVKKGTKRAIVAIREHREKMLRERSMSQSSPSDHFDDQTLETLPYEVIITHR
jgi:hypothetical protein